MADALDLTPHREVLQGGVLGTGNDILRQEPTAEVSRAWMNLTSQRVVPVSSQYLRDRGVDPAVAVRIPQSYGLGDDAYGTFSDTIHLLHCLNRVRKDVYFEYYYGTIWPNRVPSELHTSHTAHCLTVLRQFIVCQSSTDLSPKVWQEGFPLPQDEFVFARSCGNFDGIWEYMNTEGIEIDEFESLEMPPGQDTTAPNFEWQRLLLQQEDPQPEDLGL